MKKRWPLRPVWLALHRFFWTHTWDVFPSAMRCTECGEVVVFQKGGTCG